MLVTMDYAAAWFSCRSAPGLSPFEQIGRQIERSRAEPDIDPRALAAAWHRKLVEHGQRDRIALSLQKLRALFACQARRDFGHLGYLPFLQKQKDTEDMRPVSG